MYHSMILRVGLSAVILVWVNLTENHSLFTGSFVKRVTDTNGFTVDIHPETKNTHYIVSYIRIGLCIGHDYVILIQLCCKCVRC
jgi:hypothetical protein